jgi:hypothetical protein
MEEIRRIPDTVKLPLPVGKGSGSQPQNKQSEGLPATRERQPGAHQDDRRSGDEHSETERDDAGEAPPNEQEVGSHLDQRV